MRQVRFALVVGVLAMASLVAAQAQATPTKSVAASCELGGGLSLKTLPDGTAIARWSSIRLYGNGAAWINTQVELTRSASGRVSLSKAEFRIFHPAVKVGTEWGATNLTLGNGKSLVLGAPSYGVTSQGTSELVIDFKNQGSGILSDLGSGTYRVQVTHPSGKQAFEMDDDRRSVGGIREELDGMGWRCKG